jgi:hypothetical protein
MVCLALAQYLAVTLTAQPFVIDRFTIDGGGGASSGGSFSLTGTIGQWDAGATMTGGAFALTGGFWALPVGVVTPDAPILNIVPGGPGLATISWISGGPGFVLQVSDNGYAWSDAPSGAANPATVSATFPIKWYRLRKP